MEKTMKKRDEAEQGVCSEINSEVEQEQEFPAISPAEPPPPSFHLEAPLNGNGGFSLMR